MNTFRIALFLLFFSSFLGATEPPPARLYLQTKPVTLDPRRTNERRTQIILRELFEGLTRIDKSGHPSLALAHSVDTSSDGLQYIFHLRKSSWSNGSDVTAHDFERSWKATIDPSFASPVAHFLFIIKNGQKAHKKECSLDDVAIHATDDYTLLVGLERPFPAFFELLASPIFSPVYSGRTSQGKLISNGPFTLKEYNLQSDVVLEKNPAYWDKDSVLIQQLHFSIIEDPATAFALFQKGELDWYGDPLGIIPVDSISQLSSKLTQRSVGGMYWLACSRKMAHLTLETRKEISAAIDRSQLCRFLNGEERPAFSIMPDILQEPSASHFDSTTPSTATKRCAEIKTSSPLILSHWAESTSKAIAQLLQAQLQRSLGITVELAGYDWSSYIKKLYSGDFDLITMAHNPTIQDPLFHLEYINRFFWKEARFSQLIESAKHSTNTKENLIRQAEQLTQEYLPIIPLYSLCFKYAKNTRLQGEVISPIGTIELKWLEWSNTKEGET